MATALEYAAEHGDRFLTELEALTRIPSVSTDPAFAPDVARAAEWLADRMRTAGLSAVEISPTAGHPVVYGEWSGAGAQAPTVLLYAHYDVQPAVREDGWDTDPFVPTRRDGRIFARGVGDDKLHAAMIVQLAESLLAAHEPCPVNLKLVIEGEEEMGSPNFVPWVRENAARLRADYVLICDGGIKAPDEPTVIYALRGMTALEFSVRGPRADLHSGTYGGKVHNPAQVIAEMVARLHHPDGRVAVPGFYDDVADLTPEERDQLNRHPITEESLQADVGIPASWGEPGYTLVERGTARPTLEINGISGGYAGEGVKTVIPSKASAKITCRLVNNQRPAKIAEQIESFLREIKPPTVELEITRQGTGDPIIVPPDSPLAQALVHAYSQTWDEAPRYVRMGGSVPIAPVFQAELDAPTLLVGFNVEKGGFHGPNEYIHTELFHKGLATMIHLLRELGTPGD
ncbi:MAG: dipeptidase [Spirochaetota bacterium]